VKRWLGSAALTGALLLSGSPALAQSRPLVTEDPETVPVGFILLEAGVDFLHGAVFPVTGLTGNLTRIGAYGFSVGVSKIAEIQVDGAMFDRLKVTDFDPTAPLAPLFAGTVSERSSFGDVTVGAKVRFLSETVGRPAIAVRFATRLPFLDLDTGVGAQTTDFLVGVSLGKTVRSIRMVANTGFGILGDPVLGNQQNQVFTYGGSVARAVATGAEIVAELNGRLDLGTDVPPLGTENRLGIRLGGRYTYGPVRIDAAFIIGANEGDSPWGLTFGATWVFKAFELK